MSIKTIPRSEFDQLLPLFPALETLMVEQVEWFSNRSGNLLCAIAKGEGVAGWNYVILKRDKKGDLRARKVMSNFFNLSAARVDLFLSMAEIERTDCANRGRASSWLPPLLAGLVN
ncbi:MAG TPA: hypothetical protein VNL17_03805 [Verrucomicrobiae bacterium]|nr:hypothetical protein [Verrucomicrobiae bacterium]